MPATTLIDPDARYPAQPESDSDASQSADYPKANHPDAWVESGSPFTISLESFCISEALDRRSGNDLLVRSWTLYSDDPPVEMVHCFKRNAEVGQVIDNLATEHIFAVEYFQGHQPLSLHLQILEVDGHDSIEQEILTVAHLLGGVFPVLLPFTSATMPLYKSLKSIFSKRDRTAEAFASTIQLVDSTLFQIQSETNDVSATVEIPFRCGAYIFFDHDVDGTAYRLQDFRLIPTTATTSPPPSYIVIKVVPQLVQSYNPENLLANQRLAAALLNPSHMDELDLPEAVKALKQRLESLPYLRQAVHKAQLLDDLDEYRRLRRLQETEPHPHESQRDRLIRAERIQTLKTQLIQDTMLPAIAHLLKRSLK